MFNSFDLNFIVNPFKEMAEFDSRMLDVAEKKVLQHRAAQTTETPIVHQIATPRVEPYAESDFGSAASSEYFPEVVPQSEHVDQPAALPSEEPRRRKEKQRDSNTVYEVTKDLVGTGVGLTRAVVGLLPGSLPGIPGSRS